MAKDNATAVVVASSASSDRTSSTMAKTIPISIV